MDEDATKWLERTEVPLLGLSIATPLSQATVEVFASSWPPPKGDYDDTGRVVQAGDLAGLGLRMSFEEVRAALDVPYAGYASKFLSAAFPVTGNRSRNNRNTKGQPNGRRRNQ